MFVLVFVSWFIQLSFFKNTKINLVFGLMVFSHWLLDALVYSNLPLALDGSPLIGLGLVNTGLGMWIGMAIEVLLIVSGFMVNIKFLKEQKKLKNETTQA